MDTIKLVREYKRMCESYTLCEDCPNASFRQVCSKMSTDGLSRFIQTVEGWSAAHPRKTYKQDFLEKFPNAKGMLRSVVDYPNICRKTLYQGESYRECNDSCLDCWNEPMEE